MKIRLLFVLVIFLLSCGSDKIIPQKTIKGKWVDVTTKTDTLTFLSISGHDYLQLDRGKMLNNGFLQPKSGAGPYSYKLLTGKISLYWTLSSNSNYNDYYFSQVGDTLVVENFYDPNFKGSNQTFRKIE